MIARAQFEWKKKKSKALIWKLRVFEYPRNCAHGQVYLISMRTHFRERLENRDTSAVRIEVSSCRLDRKFENFRKGLTYCYYILLWLRVFIVRYG